LAMSDFKKSEFNFNEPCSLRWALRSLSRTWFN
jgi:hypothetical protein